MKSPDQFRKLLDRPQIPAADRYHSFHLLILFYQFPLCLVYQLQDLLCPAAEQHSLICKDNSPRSPQEQLYSH